MSAQVRLTTPTDILDAVPPILGFVPQESLVLLMLDDEHHVVVTARGDLTSDRGMLTDLYRRVGHRGTACVVAVYTEGSDRGRPLLQQIRALLPVVCAVSTDGRRWWDLCSTRNTAHRLPSTVSATTAALVVQGHAVEPDRQTLSRRITAPEAAEHPRLAAAYETVAGALSLLADSERPELLTGLLQRGINPGVNPLTAADQTALVWLIESDVELRDAAWAHVDRGNAVRFLHLWQQLVATTHPDHGAGALALYGFTAWAAGNGARANVAADALRERYPGYSMGQLLRDVLDRALPPETWDQMLINLRGKFTPEKGVAQSPR